MDINIEKAREEHMSLPSVVKRQIEHLIELSNFYAKLKDMRDDFKEISEKYCDNCDTWTDAEEAMLALGALIADLVVYTDEYKKDSEKETAE